MAKVATNIDMIDDLLGFNRPASKRKVVEKKVETIDIAHYG